MASGRPGLHTMRSLLALALGGLSVRVSAALPPITVPHLTGVFVSLDDVTAARSLAGWQSDLSAMKHAGIEWFAIRSTAAGADEPPVSAACPLGGFRVFFPPGPHQQPPCFQPEHRGLDTIGTILAAAKTVGLQVHLGLGYPQTSRCAQR